MRVGRHDPCPCGSGQKPKECCLAEHQVRSLVGVRSDRLAQTLRAMIGGYLYGSDVSFQTAQGLALFDPDPDLEDEEALDATAEAALDWVAFVHLPQVGEPLAARLWAAGWLNQEQREILEGWSSAVPGFFMVEGIEQGQVVLRRLPDGRSYSVSDRRILQEPGDMLAAWLLPVHSTYVCGFCIRQISPETAEPLKHMLSVEMALFKRQHPDADWDELYRACWPRLVNYINLAMLAEADVRRITPPPGPALRWDGRPVANAPGWWAEVARLVRCFADPGSPWPHREQDGAERLWWDAALALKPAAGQPEGWAAGVVYLYRRLVLDDREMTQAEVGRMLGVSAATVGHRSRQMETVLAVEGLDHRYIDILHPRLRITWDMFCTIAAGGSLAFLSIDRMPADGKP